jgi:DNA (cytosine-5)-methyltransferase 1
LMKFPWHYVRGLEIVAVHASPPCQRYSDLAKRNRNADKHPDLIGPVRELLKATGLPYVIENVEGAPLLRNQTVMLCGSMFGLGVDNYRLRRHRRFELSWPPPALLGANCVCTVDSRPVIDVTGGGPTRAPRIDGKGGRTYKGTADQARAAMGIDWMTKAELNEAIPPAYTEFIGAQLIQHASSRGRGMNGTVTSLRVRP